MKENLRRVMKWYRGQWISNLLCGMAFLLFLCGGKPFFQNWAMVALMVILLFKAVFYFVIERILAGVDVMNRDTSSSVRKVSRIKRLSLIGAIVSYALLIPLIVFLSLQFHLDTFGIIVVSVAALILAAVAVKEACLRNRHFDEIIDISEVRDCK